MGAPQGRERYDANHPIHRWDLFYSQYWEPASRLSLADIPPEAWKLAAKGLLTGYDGFTLPTATKWRGGAFEGPGAAETRRGPGGDGATALAIAEILGYIFPVFKIAEMVAYGIAGEASGVGWTSSMSDYVAAMKAKTAAEIEAHRLATVEGLLSSAAGAVSMLAPLTFGDMLSPLTQYEMERWLDADNIHVNLWGQENSGARATLARVASEGKIVLHDPPVGPSVYNAIHTRYSSDGTPFLPRVRLFGASDYVFPWNTVEMGAEFSLDDRIALRARVYRALDFMASTMYPAKVAGFGPSGEIGFKKVHPQTYSYRIGNMPVLCSIFPMVAEGTPWPEMDRSVFVWQGNAARDAYLERLGRAPSANTVTVAQAAGARYIPYKP